MSGDELIEELRRVLQSGPGLRLAMLFGSTARGTARIDSDVDIAILPKDVDVSVRDELALQARLSAAAHREVDLVRLDRCAPALRFRVAKEGIPLLAEPTELSRLRARAGIEHGELEPRQRLARALYLKRLQVSPSPTPAGSMTDVEIVLRKLAVLRDHLQRVRRRRPVEVDALLADQALQDAIGMSLLVAIQEAIDTAFHIAADEGWGIPGSNAEAFEILARNGVLSDELAREMGSAAALRNRIAHGYAGVDLPRLWAEMPTGLDSLERYVRSVAALLADRDDNTPA